MKIRSRNIEAGALRAFLLLGVGFIGVASAAELKEARVTQVVNDVKLLPTAAAPRPAAVSDEVRDGTAVRTGAESRSELKFTDQTLARLGSNTIFSFSEGTRNLNLQDGAMLLRVPKGAGGAKISSSAVTAAITGTTVMVETHPLTKKIKSSYYKFIVLEGTARLFLPGQVGESVLVKAGQMIIMPLGAKKIPEAVDVDIQKIMQSSLLITGFGPLGSELLIAFEQNKQIGQKTSGQLYETNLVIYGSGTNVVLADPNTVDTAVTAQKLEGSGPFASPTPTPTPTATPSGTPSKFGTLTTITSPVPYVITSGTTITTDPSITTNGVTDFGKIWRGPSVDGPLSVYLFGSTSAFDSASGFDSQFQSSGAGFKFDSLQLTGNPTISTTNGEINLGLIAINGITSGSPGGTLTFAGIRGLLLATQNGSITLGSEISFSGLHDINFYARGAGSILSLASDISTTSEIRLYAEGRIDVNGNLSTQILAATAGENISIGANGPVTINSNSVDLFVDTAAIGNVPNGGNITWTANQDLTMGGDLSLSIANNDGGHIGTGGNIIFSAPTVSTGGGFALLVTNYGDVFGRPGTSSGSITNGGNISLTTTAGFDANYLSAFIDNRNGGSIGSSASISVNIGGALTTHADSPESIPQIGGESLFLLLSNRFDTTSGGMIGGDATVSLNAASASVGGILDAFISNRPGTIGGSALINFNVSGALTSQEFGEFEIANEDQFNTGHGGTIHGDAAINLSAGSISTPQELELLITNRGANDPNTGALTGTPGGTIGGNALINVNTGSLSGDLFAQINNRTGSIVSDAAVSVTATSISSTGATGVDLSILDRDLGSIGGSATVTLNVSGSITSGTAGFFIGEAFGSDGPGGGTVGRDSQVVMGVGSVATDGFFEAYNNINGGAHIHGNAINTVTVTGDLSAQQGILATIEDTGFKIDFTFGAPSQIDGNALLTLSAQNITTASTATGTPGIDTMALEASIYPNVAGTVGGDAVINISATQNISAPGETVFWIANGNYNNLGPGTIGGNAEVNVSAADISTGDIFTQILNYGGASIGGHARVAVAATNLTVNGSLDSRIDNTNGTVGADATINYTVSGNSMIATDAMFQIFGSNGATSAAININGGNYTVGGTFLGNIDGNGTFTLNNVTIAADTLKVGVFGANGTLYIDNRGASMSANTLLHLYANGSNGIIHFVSNATLNSSATAVVIAAKTVTLDNGVLVTIGGSTPANVFTDFPNYSARNGGNGSTTGQFVGAGATTQPLANQPPFDSPTTTRAATKQNRPITSLGGGGRTIYVADSSQLRSLLDNATPGRDGKVRIASDTRSRSISAPGIPISPAKAPPRARDATERSGMLALRSL